MSKTQLVIYGAGGFAREVAWLAESCSSSTGTRFEVVSYVDDDHSMHGTVINGVQVRSLYSARSEFPAARIVLGVGLPDQREAVMRNAESVGFEFQTLIHPRAEYSQWVTVGEGAIVCAGSVLTTNVRVGRQVHINLGCTIGHDVVLGDFVTLAPGAHISGWVTIEAGAYIGSGATIVNGREGSPLLIGEHAVVGAGACVTRNVAPHTTVVGVPAKPLPRR